jgi:hypothetical protein
VTDIAEIDDLHGADDASGLWIGQIDSSRALVDANQSNGKESRPIHGTYNAATNQLLFNDAQFPGEILFTTLSTGYAILADNELGGVLGLAGTWQQQKLKFDPSRRIIEVETDNGGWFADNHRAPIP